MANPVWTVGGGLLGGLATVAVAERAGLSPVMAGLAASGASLAGSAMVHNPVAKQALVAAAAGAAGLVGVQVASKYFGGKGKHKRQGEGDGVSRQELQEALAKAALEHRQTSCDLLTAMREEVKLAIAETQKVAHVPSPQPKEVLPVSTSTALVQRPSGGGKLMMFGRKSEERNAGGDTYERNAYGDEHERNALGDEHRDALGDYERNAYGDEHERNAVGDEHRDAYGDYERNAYGDEHERNAVGDEHRDAYGDYERNAYGDEHRDAFGGDYVYRDAPGDEHRDAYSEYRDAFGESAYRDAYGDEHRDAYGDEHRAAYGDYRDAAEEHRDAPGDEHRDGDGDHERNALGDEHRDAGEVGEHRDALTDD